MSSGAAAAAAGGAAAAHHAMAQAIKASGAIVKITPREFVKVMNRAEAPLVVTAKGGFLQKKLRYLSNYKGIFFFTETNDRLSLPSKTEYVVAEKIWIPG